MTGNDWPSEMLSIMIKVFYREIEAQTSMYKITYIASQAITLTVISFRRAEYVRASRHHRCRLAPIHVDRTQVCRGEVDGGRGTGRNGIISMLQNR